MLQPWSGMCYFDYLLFDTPLILHVTWPCCRIHLAFHSTVWPGVDSSTCSSGSAHRHICSLESALCSCQLSTMRPMRLQLLSESAGAGCQAAIPAQLLSHGTLNLS